MNKKTLPEDLYRGFFRWRYLWMAAATAQQVLLGAGIARYLGVTLDVFRLLVGGGLTLALLFACLFASAYFERPRIFQPVFEKTGSGVRISESARLLLGGAGGFTLAAAAGVLLLQSGSLSPGLLVFQFLSLAAGLAYAVPPFRLAASGYGEILGAILIIGVVPAASYWLQAGELHRFVLMSSAPLAGLFLAVLIMFQLSDYASAVTRQQRNLTTRLGWENAMTLHNLLLLVSFVMLAFGSLSGLPRFVWFPGIILVLAALLQIRMVIRVAEGERPNWNGMIFLGVLLFGTLGYLIAYGFWVN